MADRITYVGLDVHKEASLSRSPRRAARRGAGIRPDREHGDGAGPPGCASSAAMARPCDFAMRRGRAAMAFSVS